MNMFLIGFRCTGKTSVGRNLARQLQRPFIDTDKKLMDEQGRTIDAIVGQDGWDAFRSLESELIERVCAVDNQVVATGGGAVLDPRNVQNMQKTGVLIWLQASPETIRKRMAQDPSTKNSRPALTSSTSLDEIEENLAARDSLYRNVMHCRIETDNKIIKTICDEIIAYLAAQPINRNV